MLGTRERTLLLESLRPPAGYRLRRAVGTSFTLDLMALLFAVHRRQADTRQPTMNREYASITNATYANPDQVGT